MKRAADSDLSEAASKKPRYDDVAREKLKDQLAMKYGAVAAGEAGAAPGTAVSDLSDELNKNKIMEIKKKIMANRRTRIKGDGEEGDRGLASFADIESDRCGIGRVKFRKILCFMCRRSEAILHFECAGLRRSCPGSGSGGPAAQSYKATGKCLLRTS